MQKANRMLITFWLNTHATWGRKSEACIALGYATECCIHCPLRLGYTL